MCPWVLRALFNYLDLENQATQGGIPPPRHYRTGRTSDVIEYLDWDRNRIALAQKERHTNRAWDPKTFVVDGVQWRAYRDEEPHACKVCALAPHRPLRSGA